MLPFLKKDLLLQLRDRKELMILLVMPLLLIGILTVALGGFGQGGEIALDVSAALVIDDDEAAGLSDFDAALAASDLAAPAKLQLGVAARTIRPVQMLREVLQDPELSGFMTVSEMSSREAVASLARNEVKAVIVAPEGYTRSLLGAMLLGERPGADLHLELSDASPLSASVFEDVVRGFATTLNTRTALGQLGVTQLAETAGGGSIEPVVAGRSVASSVYYMFGMAVMFVLYTVGAVASRAYLEVTNLSFDRIVVSGARPASYLASKATTGALMVVLQMAFLLLAASFLFGATTGQPASFWSGVALVSVTMALAVGALAALVTAVNFRLGSKSVSEAFNSVIAIVMALLGGSFLPLDQSAPALAAIGRWLPNGAAFDAFLDLAAGAPFSVWGANLTRLLIGAAALLIAAVALFPKQRSA